MTDELARNKLVALLPGNVLKIITNQCVSSKCIKEGSGGHDTTVPPLLPAHFVCHDVIRFEDRINGNLRAYTAEGDWCEGRPTALLPRLLEAIGVSVQDTPVPVAPAPVLDVMPDVPVVQAPIPEPEITEPAMESPITLSEQQVEYLPLHKSRWQRFLDWLGQMDSYEERR